MKKLIWIIIAGLLFVSCSDQSSNDPESIRKQINNYREEMAGLNEKIAELEEQLDKLDTPENQKKGLMVRVEEARTQPFSEYFEATGELEAEEEAFISPESPGQIAEIYVVEGQKVNKGQLLAKLNTDLIERNIDEVKTQLDFAETMFKKQKELWSKNIGSERQYLDAKNKLETLQNKLRTLETQYKKSLIYAPINGYVEEIFQKEGEQASPGFQMMQIVSLDKMKVTANISEAYLPVIHEGDTVEITFPTFPGLVMHKPISRIGHVVSKQNRTFKVQVYVDNKDGLLKPNLLATIKINNYNSDNHIVIPSRVVREDMKGAYLYVAQKEGEQWTAKKKYITLGKSYRNKSEILSGLESGELIITDGFNNVTDGTLLTITK
jgi:RND family efflux transporter MFP subunit